MVCPVAAAGGMLGRPTRRCSSTRRSQRRAAAIARPKSRCDCSCSRTRNTAAARVLVAEDGIREEGGGDGTALIRPLALADGGGNVTEGHLECLSPIRKR